MKKQAIGMAVSSAMLLPALGRAHEGHGLGSAHWHATDAWGFLAAGVAAAVAFWFIRRK